MIQCTFPLRRPSLPRLLAAAVALQVGVLAAPAALACQPDPSVDLSILGVHLADDGDHDGFADTNETVSMRLTLQNNANGWVDVTLYLTTDDPDRVCITQSTIHVEGLARGETRTTSEAFVFTVSSLIDRSTLGLDALDELSAAFRVTAVGEGTWQEPPPSCAFYSATQDLITRPDPFRIELDLDVDGGAGPTTFAESFEGSLGAFEVDNMDAGMSDETSADGSRCQYNDPDRIFICVDPPCIPFCYPGDSPQHAAEVFWGVDGPGESPSGGRGFTGQHSLYFGVDLGPPAGWTTPMATLEAVATTDPIHLGWDGVTPMLSFFHQISLVDSRTTLTPEGQSIDRGVVMAQYADDQSEPVGPWFKLVPSHNVHDAQATDVFTANCMFDPVDDGTTEDDLFDPTDPHAKHGPSSTCNPEKTFVYLGSTDGPFDPLDLGRGDPPGLAGEWGPGTWVETKFDLSRYRGRSLRLRFLATTLKTDPSAETYEELVGWNPIAGDDGWWIDDVTVTGALETPATVTVDDADNSSLPGLTDTDADGVGDVCDNCSDIPNANQRNGDLDGFGDACDPCTDVDGDGFGDSGYPLNLCPEDNCPALANPDQADADGDGDGDVCDDCTDVDGDGLGATGTPPELCPKDNCPAVFNPMQTDGDGDGSGLACDCDDADAAIHPGAPEVFDGKDNQCEGDVGYGVVDEVSGLSGFLDSSDRDAYSWPAQAGAVSYQVARSTSADFAAGCHVFPRTSDTTVIDAAPVPPATIHHYLVRSWNGTFGSWGQDSNGVARVVCP